MIVDDDAFGTLCEDVLFFSQRIDGVVIEWFRKGERQLKGTYGYVVKPHAAKRLVQGAYEDGITASDMFVKDKYVRIQVVTPRAVMVTDKQSLTVPKQFYI